MAKGKVLFNEERYVESVYDRKTGKLESHCIRVDLIPNRVKGIKAGRKVVVTISEWRRPK